MAVWNRYQFNSRDLPTIKFVAEENSYFITHQVHSLRRKDERNCNFQFQDSSLKNCTFRLPQRLSKKTYWSAAVCLQTLQHLCHRLISMRYFKSSKWKFKFCLVGPDHTNSRENISRAFIFILLSGLSLCDALIWQKLSYTTKRKIYTWNITLVVLFLKAVLIEAWFSPFAP